MHSDIKFPINHISESVIREMTRLAEKHHAINLSQGLPDFPCPALMKDAARQAILEDANQYSFTYGLEPLREQIAEKLERRNFLEYDPVSEITVTCGVSEGLMASLFAISEPGAEIIVFEPFYENYVPGILLCGGRPVTLKLNPPDWQIDFDQLARCFNSRTKAIVINNPMNPTGKVFTAEELGAIAELCLKWDVIAICDEIYEDLIFDEQPHYSLAALPDMADQTITIMGFSKTFSVTGWRVGYVAASEHLSSKIRKVHDYLTVCAPTPLQHACQTALTLPDEYYDEMRRFYKKKRHLFCLGLRDLGFRFSPPSAAYYVMADFGEIYDGSDWKFVNWLLLEEGIAVVPGSSFYYQNNQNTHLVRFCFAKQEETLVAALRRMGNKILRSPVSRIDAQFLLV